MHLKGVLPYLLSLVLLLLSAGRIGIANDPGKQPHFLQSGDSEWVEKTLKELSLDEKIAQLFMVAAYSNMGEDHKKHVRYMVEKLGVGGLIFFQGSPSKQVELTRYYQSEANVPLLIAMDAEWGPSMRIDSTLRWPYQMQLGAIDNDELVYDMGAAIAQELKQLGVHINFAPVVDINSNPNNPVINHRSFGEDVVNVTRKSLAYMNGLQDNGVLAFAKHFPGHGDTHTDSHHALPIVNRSRAEVLSTEGIPYQYLIKRGLAGIMVGHLLLPQLDSVNPASLSPVIIQNLLQESLQFEGLCITDALNMAGAQRKAEPGEVEVDALLAGNDILLMSTNVGKSIKAIRKAVKNGILSEERIDRSCRKVLKAKYAAGLAEGSIPEGNDLVQQLNRPSSKALLRNLKAESVSLIKNEGIIPYADLENFTPELIYFGEKPTVLHEALEWYDSTLFAEKPKADWDQWIPRPEANHLIIAFEAKSQSASSRFGITPESVEKAMQLAKTRSTTLILLGNPYALRYFPSLNDFDAVLVLYNADSDMQELAAQALFGGIPLKGRIPVGIEEHGIRAGDGERVYKPIRLSFGLPEMQGMNSDSLHKIDSLLYEAIEAEAMPGAQVLVARNGMVVYHRAFGKLSYDKPEKLSTHHVYDLASITKIAATLPLLMHFDNKGLFDVNQPLAHYLAALDTSNKSDLTSKEILAHQAGLQAWIPFFRNILASDEWAAQVFSESPDSLFSIPLGARLYIRNDYRDSILHHIIASELREEKDYKYSDLGFYLFQEYLEQTSGKSLNELCDSLFYRPLGASTLSYLPLERMDKKWIVPTELDGEFRQELVHGNVHDPGAAMLGGVAGHAGLFSNALDLAKMMQMYLWGGSYGNRQFLPSSLIRQYATPPYPVAENRRALGFDKPEFDPEKDSPISRLASARSYGHSGFTGTITWVDPDKELVYVLLTNRVNPDSRNNRFGKMNVRPRVADIIYRSIH